MPTTVTVHQAKTNLSDLLRRVEAGEEIVIARGNKPVAVLKSYDREELARKRRGGEGAWDGKIEVLSDSVFEPMTDADIAEAFGEEFLEIISTPAAKAAE
jgi:prevent-host-death family protein